MLMIIFSNVPSMNSVELHFFNKIKKNIIYSSDHLLLLELMLYCSPNHGLNVQILRAVHVTVIYFYSSNKTVFVIIYENSI